MEHSSADLIAAGATILLAFVVVPMWILAGLADYLCHRASDIEHTAGTRESALHLIQFGLVGIPLTAALFFQVDAGLLAIMVLFIVLHHAVAYIDVRYANGQRGISPLEQMVHSFLELLPITAFLLLCTLEFSQVRAALGFSAEQADFGIHLRRQPLHTGYIAFVMLSAAVIDFLPYLEELVRCVRAARRKADVAPAS